MPLYRIDGPVAWVTLARRDKLNAMDRDFGAELRGVLARADVDPDVRALVFAGECKSLSVGGDIDGFGRLGGPGDRRVYLSQAIGTLGDVAELEAEWAAESEPSEAAAHVIPDDVIDPAATRTVPAHAIDFARGSHRRITRTGQ